MSNLFKKITSATMALLIVLSIVSPVSGVMAAYSTLESANKLASLGVIVDNSANPANYRLGDSITRGEMAKVTMKLSEQDVVDVCEWKFADLTSADWACKYAEAGLANGYFAANTTFRPQDNVTKVEALKMVMQARGVAKSSNADWMAAYVEAALEAGILDASFTDYNTVAVRGWIFQIAVNAIEGMDDDDDGLLDDLLGNLDDEDTGTGTTGTGDTDVVVTGWVLVVSLSPETADAASIPGGVNGIPVASFDLTAGDEDVTVTSVTVKRRGLSDSNTLTGLAAFTVDGRASKAKNDSLENDTEATLTLTNGLVVKAWETTTLIIVADVNTAANAANDEFAIELKEVVASASVETEGSLVGNSLRVGSVDAATLTVEDNGTVSNPKLGEEGVNIFKFQLVWDNDDDIVVNSLTFRSDSSDAEEDLTNFKLMLGSTELAATTSMNGKYLTFNLVDWFTVANSKTEKFTVTADVIGGAGDTLSWYVDKNLDISALDTKYGYGASINIDDVDVAADLWSFVVQAWELTLVDIDPASDKMREDKDDVILAKLAVTNVAGKALELQKFWVLATLTAGSGTIGGTGITLATLFENFELVNEDTGSAYELELVSGVYQDLDLNIALAQGVTNFLLRADTQDWITLFDTVSVDFSLDATLASWVDAAPTNGQFFVVETEDDTVVSDFTPSSLTWKKITGTEAGATLTQSPLSDLTKVRGTKWVVGLLFEIDADDSSALTIDELKVFVEQTTQSGVTWTPATNATISQVTLYKWSVSDANLLDRVSWSNLAAGFATFDWFEAVIAADAKQTFVVTVDYVDGADTTTNSPYTLTIRASDISAEDDDNDDVVVSGGTLTSARNVTITNFGTLALSEDAQYTDNRDAKTILAGTNKTIFSIGVQATNESVDVETVVFTVDTDLRNAVESASLYLGDTLIATNSNSDFASGTITFDSLTTLIIPQESKELKLMLNTATIWFERVWLSVAGVNVTQVALSDAQWVDSGKAVTGVSDTSTATSKDVAIVPATLTPSVAVSLLSSTTPQIRLTSSVGSNVKDTSNSKPNALVNTISFSNLGTSIAWTGVYTLTNSDDSADTAVWVLSGSTVTFTLTGSLDTANRTITADWSETFKITITGTAEGDTVSLTLLENGVNYDVEASWDSNDATNTAGTTINLGNELDYGTRSY